MTRELKGGHVLAVLLAFFGVTIAVNVVFTMYAIDTFSGEDVSRPYLRGLEYNRTLETRAAQAALGWKAQVDAARDRDGVALTANVSDRDGNPKSTLAVELTLRRPTDASLDRIVSLNAVGNGMYRTVTGDLAPGAWDIILRAKDGSAVTFEAERRVVLK
jgi:nitrogen fixation protein FixH